MATNAGNIAIERMIRVYAQNLPSKNLGEQIVSWLMVVCVVMATDNQSLPEWLLVIIAAAEMIVERDMSEIRL